MTANSTAAADLLGTRAMLLTHAVGLIGAG
jgi:hypothetical protein